jgi:hypothetical protein
MTAALAAVLSTVLLGGLAGCDNKGPVEKAGMKVDHTIDAMKNGGHETPGDKAEDAADHVKEGVKDAADDLKK